MFGIFFVCSFMGMGCGNLKIEPVPWKHRHNSFELFGYKKKPLVNQFKAPVQS